MHGMLLSQIEIIFLLALCFGIQFQVAYYCTKVAIFAIFRTVRLIRLRVSEGIFKT